MNELKIETIRDYWSGKNVPQQWYSDKTPLSLSWFNEIRKNRFTLYYDYLMEEAEFEYHTHEKVLEVGCGIGTDLAEYAIHGSLVTGIDLGEDQVHLTKLNFELRSLPYEEIKQCNAEKLTFDDNVFDLVYSFGCLHHTPHTQKAVDEIHRVLRKDGQAIVMLYARGWKHYIKRCFVHGILLGKWAKSNFDWGKVYNDVSEVHGSSPQTKIYTKSQIKKIFAGFANVEIRKKRLGEFIEYAPYRTFIFPKFFRNFLNFFNAQAWFGENWIIKAGKAMPPKKVSVFKVIFKHY